MLERLNAITFYDKREGWRKLMSNDSTFSCSGTICTVFRDLVGALMSISKTLTTKLLIAKRWIASCASKIQDQAITQVKAGYKPGQSQVKARSNRLWL